MQSIRVQLNSESIHKKRYRSTTLQVHKLMPQHLKFVTMRHEDVLIALKAMTQLANKTVVNYKARCSSSSSSGNSSGVQHKHC
jgi:hypothetical protein